MTGSGRLLLVEDEAIIALSTSLMLRERGYAVEHVLSGEAARDRVAAAPESVDLVLMDINLGRGMTGPEAAKEILSAREIPIVFLSSHTEQSIVESTEEISSYGYVVKNSGITVLDASIRMAFRLFEARKSIHAKNMAIEASNEALRVTIEELTAANRKLAQSEEKFQKAFLASPDSININRLSDGVYLDINEGFTAMTGYEREDAIGRSSLPGDLGIWVHAEDRARMVAALGDSGEVRGLEAEFRRKDGSVLIGMMSAKVIEIEGERCLLNITRDITERKVAEDLIRDSESRFRAAFANAPLGMAILSPSLDLRMVNRAFCSMLGYTMLEASSMEYRDLLLPEDLAASEAAAARLNAGEEGPTRLLARYLHKGGGIVWTEESLSLMGAERGQAQALAVHAVDITERKQAEERAAKLDRIRSAVSEAMQLVVREGDTRRLLEGACDLAVAKGGLRMAWIGMLDEEGQAIKPYASAGLVDGYLDGFSIPMSPATIGPALGRGPTGTALREGRNSVSQDIGSDERMTPWREKALVRGYRSSASFPLVSNGLVMGTFSVYADSAGFFGEEELGLLAQLALDISFALDSIRKQQLRSETERKLRESEALYRASFLQSSAIKLLIDPEDYSIADANFAAADYYGYSLSVLRGKTLMDINADPPAILAKQVLASKTRQQNHFFANHRQASGEVREVEVYSSPIQIAGKTLLHSILHDVTEQKLTERALRDSENRFRAVFDRAPVGMSLTGPDGRLAAVNQAFCDMIGRSASEIIHLPYAEITHPEDLPASDEAVGSCLSGERSSARLVKRYLHRGGRSVWADVSIALIRDEEGNPEVFITHMLDITERKKAEETLERLVGEKDTLMRELQHRVKNNLGVVLSLLNLEEGKCPEGPAKGVLSDSIARIRSISAIYERLYLSEDLTRVDLALYVEDLANSVFSTYNLDPERVALRIRAESVQLDTKRSVPLGLILNELLTNALKYAYPSGKGGEVRVELSQAGGRIELGVSDDGVSIPDEYLYPGSQSMGMRLVRMLAEQLDGGLIIENKGGTKVRVSFPA